MTGSPLLRAFVGGVAGSLAILAAVLLADMRSSASEFPTFLVYVAQAHELQDSLGLRYRHVGGMSEMDELVREPEIGGVILDRATMLELPVDQMNEWRVAGTVFVALGTWGEELRQAVQLGSGADLYSGQRPADPHYTALYQVQGTPTSYGALVQSVYREDTFPAEIGSLASFVQSVLDRPSQPRIPLGRWR